MSKTIKDITYNEFKIFCDSKKKDFNGCGSCSLSEYCEYIDFNSEFFNSDKKAFSDELLNTQVKKRPSKDAITILKHIDSKYKWIAKDSNNFIWIFLNKPSKQYNSWMVEIAPFVGRSCSFFDNEIFNFLSWDDEEPTNIDELLREYEDD